MRPSRAQQKMSRARVLAGSALAVRQPFGHALGPGQRQKSAQGFGIRGGNLEKIAADPCEPGQPRGPITQTTPQAVLSFAAKPCPGDG